MFLCAARLPDAYLTPTRHPTATRSGTVLKYRRDSFVSAVSAERLHRVGHEAACTIPRLHPRLSRFCNESNRGSSALNRAAGLVDCKIPGQNDHAEQDNGRLVLDGKTLRRNGR